MNTTKLRQLYLCCFIAPIKFRFIVTEEENVSFDFCVWGERNNLCQSGCHKKKWCKTQRWALTFKVVLSDMLTMTELIRPPVLRLQETETANVNDRHINSTTDHPIRRPHALKQLVVHLFGCWSMIGMIEKWHVRTQASMCVSKMEKSRHILRVQTTENEITSSCWLKTSSCLFFAFTLN